MAYGYIGDLTPDSNSLRGIGAFAHTSKPGSLVPDYSAALTDAEAARRNLKPGDTFTDAGKTYRYDDRQPGDSSFVDVYTPDRAPDPGVSPQEIARQAAIATGRGQGLLESLAPGSGVGNDVVGKLAIPDSYKAFLSDDNKPVTNAYPGWFKTATAQDVKDFDEYANNGNDVTKLPLEDVVAVATAKNPQWLLQPENKDAFNELVLKPQDENYNPVMAGLTAAWNLPGGLAKAAYDAAKTIGAVNDLSYHVINGLVKKTTGWAPYGDAAAAWGKGGDDLKQAAGDIASLSGGVGQTASDLQTAFEGVAATGAKFQNWQFQNNPLLGQDVKQASSDNNILAQQSFARDMFNSSQYARNLQQTTANLYKGIGVTAQLGQAVEKAKIDPEVADGVSQLAQIIGMEGIGTIASGTMKAIRPLFTDQALFHVESNVATSAEEALAKMHTEVPGLQQAVDNHLLAQGSLSNVDRLIQKNIATGESADLSKPLLQGLGISLKTIAKIPDIPGAVGDLISKWNPMAGKVAERIFDSVIALKGIEHLGPLQTMAAGMGVVGAKAVLENSGELLNAMGKEGLQARSFIPYWQRVAQQLGPGIPRNVALGMDKPLIYALGDAAKGGIAGLMTGGALGAASNPSDPVGGAIGGAGFGGVFASIGGGFGQVINYHSPDTIRLNQFGDRARYRDTLSTPDKALFDQLNPRNQLMMGTFMAQYPGVRVKYFNDPQGVGGEHVMNPDATTTIHLNTAVDKQTIAPLLAHELGHQAAFHGILPDIYDALLGNPDTNLIGQYTQLDGNGKPTGVNPDTLRYNTNADWDALKQEYVNRMAGLKDNAGRPVDVSHLSDTQLAKEIYAEHQASYLLSGQHVVDTMSAADPYWLGRGQGIKQAMMSIGGAFDTGGNLVRGAGIFDEGVERNPQLMALAKQQYSSKMREGSLSPEDAISHKLTRDDIQNPNVRATILDSAPEFQRDANGNVVMNGKDPVLHTKGEVDKTMRNMGAAMDRSISQIPDEQKLAIDLKQTGQNTYSMRYMPDSVLDATLKENQNNTTQAGNLRFVNSILADGNKQGTELSMFLHKATMNGRYGQFAGQYRDLTPYLFEKTQHGNINIKGVDFTQLTNNYLKYQGRPGIKGVWNNVSDFLADTHKYFTNHAKDMPGETDLGTTKRDAINVLTGINKSGNPLKDQVKVRNGIIKSFRIDRINRLRTTGEVRPFTDEGQYYKMAQNFAPQVRLREHPEAEKLRELHTAITEKAFRLNPDVGTVRVERDPHPDTSYGYYDAPSPTRKINDLKNKPGTIRQNIDLLRKDDHLELNFIHELMHAQDHLELSMSGTRFGSREVTEGWRDNALTNFFKTVQDTDHFQSLRNKEWDATSSPYFKEEGKARHFRYLLRPEEITARAFTQYAVNKINQPELTAKMERSRTENPDRWYSDKDFNEKISPAIDKVVEDYGLKPGTGPQVNYAPRVKPVVENNLEPWQKGNGASNMPEVDGKDTGFVHLMGGGAKAFAIKGDVDNISDRSKGYLIPAAQNQMASLLAGGHIDKLANSMIQEYKNVWSKSSNAMAAKDWYSRMTPMLSNYLKGDPREIETFTRFLAATSPQSTPDENFKYALEAYTRHKEGMFDPQIRDYLGRLRRGEELGAHYPEELSPLRDNGKKFGHNGDAVLRVAAGTWDSGGPKTPQFKDNLMGTDHGATIDLWAARTIARLLGHTDSPIPKAAPSNLEFAIGQHAFAKAASKLGMKPDELQAVAWYGEKEHYDKMGWQKADYGSYHPNIQSEISRVQSGGLHPWVDPNRPGFRGVEKQNIYVPPAVLNAAKSLPKTRKVVQ